MMKNLKLFSREQVGIASENGRQYSRPDSLSLVSRQSVLVFLLVLLTTVFGVGNAWATDYELVTSTSQLVAGAHYVIGAPYNSNNSFIATTDNANNRKITNATVSNNKVTATESMMTFTLGGSTGAWTFATDNYAGTAGYLNATNTTGSNNLKIVAALDSYAYFTIELNGGVATITCNGKESRNIMYLNGTTCISCYNTQTTAQYVKPRLYKEVASGCDKKVTISKGTPSNGTFSLDKTGEQNCCDALTVTVSDITPAAGYAFSAITQSGIASGVTINQEAKTVTYDANTTGTSTINVTFVELPKYTVSFSTGEGNPEVVAKTETVGGQGIELPTGPTPACTDWTFAGWKETSAVDEQTTTSPTLLAAGANYKPASNCTLYAVYSKTVGGGGGAAVGTTMWAEDFTGAGNKTTPTSPTTNGSEVYGSATVTYAWTDGGTTSQVYLDTNGPHTDSNNDNALISKTNGALTISGIPTGNASTLTLDYAVAGQGTIVASTTTDNVTISGSTITISDANIESFTLVFTNTHASKNSRIDDIIVTVATTEAAGATYYISAPTCAAPDQCETPEFSPAAGTYNVAKEVTLSCETDGATIHYTTNGDAPTNSSATYSSAIAVNENMTIKAIAVKDGSTDSEVAEAVYVLKPATPEIAGSASFVGATNVTITCETEGVEIRYTTNGDAPTASSTLYSAPFEINASCTVKAIAVKTNWTSSDAASKEFTKHVPLTTMDEIFSAASSAGNYYITFSEAWVVTGVSTNGKNVYISDGTKGMILFNNSGDMGLAVGNTLSGTVQRSLKLYSGSAELDGFTTEGLTKGTADLPAVQVLDAAGIEALSGVNTGSLVKISGAATQSGTKYYVAGVQLYNALSTAYTNPTVDKNYYVTGVYAQYNTTKEVMPRSAEDVEEMKYQLNYILPAQGTLSIKQNETLVSSGTKWVEDTEFTLSSTTPSDDYKAGVYTVTDWGEPANDVTADVLSGNTLTMPKYNVIVTVAFPEKAAAPISWSNSGATVNVHIDNTDDLPTLTKGEFTVTCNSSDENVATVDNDGVVTMVGAGTTTISAVFAGDDDYKATTVSYELTVLPDFYVTGTAVGGWDSDKVPVAGTSYTIKNLAAGSYKLKITIDGTWGTAKGFSDLTASEVIAGLYNDNDGNICFTLKAAGDVVVTYTGEVYKLAGNFEPQAVKVKGGWDSWTEHAMTLSGDKKSASVTVALPAAENVEFGIQINTDDFRANGGTYDREHASATGITGNSGNMKLTSDIAGDYTFTWTFGTNALNITFPKDEAGLEWSAAAATAYTVGKSYTLPTLTNEHGLGVTYSSTEGTVATISNEEGHKGEITLVGAGSTTIKATSAATSLYNAGEASYTLTVLAPASVVVTGDATKKAYEAGETFSFVGLGAKAVYAENDEYEIPSDIIWAPAPAPVINANGNVEVTATWEGKTSAVKNIAVTVNTHAVTFAAPANGTLVVKKLVGEVWTAINSGDEFVNGTTLKVEAAANAGYKLTALTAGGVDILESKQFTVGTAAVAVEATVVAKTAAGLSWPNATATAYSVGKSYTLQTLTNPNSLTVAYASSNTDVATINAETGAITVKAAGSTVITATSAETDVYAAGEASYTLNVYAPATVVVTGDAEKDAYEAGETFSFAGLGAKAVYAENDEYTIPANDIVWTNSLTDNKVNAAGDVTVTAEWQGLSGNKVVGVTLLSHELTFNTPTNGTLVVEYNDAAVETGDHFLKGDVLTITATADPGYKLTSLTVNDADFVSGNNYTVGTEDIAIVATFTAKTAAGLSWPNATATAYTVGKSYTLQTLTNPHSLTVAYASSNTDVATINAETGAITVKAAGSTVIKATSAETDVYAAGEASYTLNVLAPASVVVTGEAEKDAYEAGETFSFAGLGAKAVYAENDEYTIPANDIVWTNSLTDNKVEATGNVTVTATWQGLSGNKVVGVTLLSHELTFNTPTNGTLVVEYNDAAVATGDHFLKGDVLTITATPASIDYKLASLTVNGEAFTSGSTYTVGTEDIDIVVSFTKKPEPTLSWSIDPNNPKNVYLSGRDEDNEFPTAINPLGLPLTYGSLNGSVAEIDAEGNFILHEAGFASMYFNFAGNETYCSVHREYPLTVYALDRIEIGGEATATEYEAGDAFDRSGLTATAVYKVGAFTENYDVTTKATWNAAPATIAANTTQVSVTAAWNGKTSAAKNVAVTVNTYAVTFEAPANGTLVVKNGGAAISSGNEFAKGTVLTVEAAANAGYKLTALTAGGVDILESKQFTVGEAAVAVEATVVAKTAAGLSWPNATATAYTVGKSYTLQTLTNPNSLTVAYASSNTDVATINAESGDITVKAAGSTVITATSAETDVYAAGVASYTLDVYGPAVLAISGEATKTSYEKGDAFDRTGLVASVLYGDASVLVVTDLATWTADPATVTANGNVTVTAEWEGLSDDEEVAVTVKTHKVIFDAPTNGSLEILNGEDAVASGAEFVAGTELTITATADQGYKLSSLTVNGEDFVSGETYTMGAQAVVVVATFVQDSGTTIDNAEAGEKAQKIMLNNQLFILRGGKMYDAQGKLVK